MECKDKCFKLIDSILNGNSIYRSIIGLIIGIIGAIGILMYLNILKWNSEFKVADLVGIIAAILTLWAIYISSQAAKSAQISAEIARDATSHTEQQTLLLKEQFERSINPKLIPSLIKINRNFLSITEFGDSIFDDDTSVMIKNVGKGNAYYISSWIELNDVDRYLDLNLKTSYMGMMGAFKYDLEFIKANKYEESKISIRQFRENSEGLKRTTNKSFYINHPTIPHPSLNESESIDFPIPKYVLALFGNIICNGPYIKGIPEDNGKRIYKFTLYIRYQTDTQLQTSSYSISKFDLVLNRINITNGSREQMSMTAGFIPKGVETIKNSHSNI